MSTDAGSGFDHTAAGRDAGDELLDEETRPIGDEVDDDALEERRERKQVEHQVNDAF
jgi:hypothetical protein